MLKNMWRWTGLELGIWFVSLVVFAGIFALMRLYIGTALCFSVIVWDVINHRYYIHTRNKAARSKAIQDQAWQGCE